jgi:hypothetical protein
MFQIADRRHIDADYSVPHHFVTLQKLRCRTVKQVSRGWIGLRAAGKPMHDIL